MGVLFIVFAAACVLLAATLISFDARLLYWLSLLSCAAAVIAYAATRLVPFPMLADDRGNWLEPLGVASLGAEATAVIAAVRTLRPVRRAGRPVARAACE